MNYFKMLFDLYRLKKQTRFTRKQIHTLQNEKLKKLLRYAWEHSDYYRRTFEKAGITKEQLNILPLSCLPTISKKELLEYFDEIVADRELKQEEIRAFDEQAAVDRKPYKGKYHVVHSSGSTGKPGYFIYDESAWNSMLLGIIRAALWGVHAPDCEIASWKAEDRVYCRYRWTIRRRYGGGRRH